LVWKCQKESPINFVQDLKEWIDLLANIQGKTNFVKQKIKTASFFLPSYFTLQHCRSVPGPPQKTRRSETKEGLLASPHFSVVFVSLVSKLAALALQSAISR